MKDLQKLFEECKKELDTIGVKYGNIQAITVNTRAKKRWGQCCTEVDAKDWKNREFSINISERLLRDDISDLGAKDTIIHELLHTCEGCMNHGKEWKRLADLVNDCYSYYHVSRCSSSEEKGIKEDEPIRPKEYKYILQCKACGRQYKQVRMSKSIKHPEWYNCCCGGELERIK